MLTSTSAENWTPKWYLRTFEFGKAGSRSSRRKTRNVKPPWRPKLDEPSVRSPCSFTSKWPSELIQPCADIRARPKRSMLAPKSITHWPAPSTNEAQVSSPPLPQCPTVTAPPPIWIRKCVLNFMTSRMLMSPSSESRNVLAPSTTPFALRETLVVFSCSSPAAVILMMSAIEMSIATASRSVRPGLASL